MKYLVMLVIAFFPMDLAAGSLVPIMEETGLTASSSGPALESTITTSVLSAGNTTTSLQGQASESSLAGVSNEEGLHGRGLGGELHGKGKGAGLMGFVPAPPPPPPQPESEAVRYELRDLHFEYDSAALAGTEAEVIADLAAIINRTAPRRITLIGHTDRRGDPDYNLHLSKRRALAVRDALVEWHGFDPALFQVFGRGEEELLSDGLTEADHARDRRVVAVLS